MECKQCHRIKCKAVDYERFQNVTDTWIQHPQIINSGSCNAVITKQIWIPRTKASKAASLTMMGQDKICSSLINGNSSGDNVCFIVGKFLSRAQHVVPINEVIIKDDKTFSSTFLPRERLFPSRLMVVSCTAKQSRTSDTTVCHYT